MSARVIMTSGLVDVVSPAFVVITVAALPLERASPFRDGQCKKKIVLSRNYLLILVEILETRHGKPIRDSFGINDDQVVSFENFVEALLESR